MTDNYSIIEQKLLRFIRKYYLNRLIRGLLYTVLSTVLLLLVLFTAENRLWMGITARTVFFWAVIVILVAIIAIFIIGPVLKLFRLSKGLSERDAALLIGKHFPEVDDMLLNTLELKALLDRGEVSTDLLEASIAQKTTNLKPVPFQKAVNLRANLKYLRFVVPAVLVFLGLWIFLPSFISEPAERLIHYSQEYEKPLPYRFEVMNTTLKTVQNSDFALRVAVSGDMRPENVYVLLGDVKYRLTPLSDQTFLYQFRNLNRNQDFRITAGEVTSSRFTIEVFPAPVLTGFQIETDYPAHTGLRNEVFANLADLSVPEGTRLTWKFFTRDTDSLFLLFPDTSRKFATISANTVKYSQPVYNALSFSAATANKHIAGTDTLPFNVNTIKDKYPLIEVTESTDSVLGKRLFFNGSIKDDYGFSSLRFFYKHLSGNDTTGILWSEEVPLSKTVVQQAFFYDFDLQNLMLIPGDKVVYYFEVCDNDGINGFKCTATAQYQYEAPTFEEIEQLAESTEDDLIDKMDQALSETQNIRKEIEELTRKMLENQEVTWEEKEKFKELMERQENLEDNMQNLMEENEMMNIQESEYKDFDPEILEKQQQLEELFQELMSEEMKEMFEEMQKLMEEMDKNKMGEMLEEMEMSNDELEQQLDRTLEMFKKLEVEKDINDYADQLEKLAEEQMENAENTSESNDQNLQKALDKQEELTKQFEKLAEKMDQIMEKNDALEQPFPIDDPASDEEQVKSDQQQSMQQMQDGQKQKSSQSQKNAANKMQQMAESMMNMMAGMQMQQLAEDMNSLRQLLENLVQLSFMQEDLISSLNVMKRNDPQYIDLIRDQHTIRTDLELVKDSLQALGKRQMAIKPFITEKINDLNRHVESAIENLTEYRTANSLKEQQYSMTAINDLALLLAEAMDQMQNQMQSMQSGGQGNSTCPSPGGDGQMDVSTMRQLQEQLSKQLEEMKKGMKPGGQQQGGMSEQLARAAAQQMAIRRQLQQMADKMMEESGQVSGNMKQILKDMEQNETDIVNKRITQTTINRQKDIVTRLLQSERAEQQREKDDQRKSDEAKNQKYSNPDALLQYKKEKEKQVEMLKTVPPSLNPFFRVKVNDYFYRVKGE